MAVKNEAYYLKQISKALVGKSSHDGFNLLVTLVSTIISVFLFLCCKLASLIYKTYKTKADETKEQEEAVQELVSLLRFNEYDVIVDILKSTIDYKNTKTKQNMNFYLLSNPNRELTVVNALFNKVLGGILKIESKKDTLENSVIIVDNDLEIIKEKLNALIGINVRFRVV